MIGLKYKLFGAEETRRTLGRAAKAASNPTGLLEKLGQKLLDNNKRNFERNAWPALRCRGGSPLRSSRDLLYRAATVKGSKGNIFEIGRNTVKIGVNLPYARIHAKGGKIKAKNWFTKHGSGPWLVFKCGNRWVMKKQVTLPARNYLALNRSTPSILSRTTGFWMKDQLKTVYR